jgi:hypothetical protein
MMRHPGERGQATVELIALLPVLLVVAAALASALAAGRAREAAAGAAQAGATALMGHADARAAALDAVPQDLRPGLRVDVQGGRVRVRVLPRVPLAALRRRLAATSTATAEAPR